MCAAVINFNDGLCGLLDVFSHLNLDHGGYTQTFCVKHDEKRINSMDIKCLAKVKQRRKRLRAIRKGFQDKHEEAEGETYASGAFV